MSILGVISPETVRKYPSVFFSVARNSVQIGGLVVLAPEEALFGKQSIGHFIFHFYSAICFCFCFSTVRISLPFRLSVSLSSINTDLNLEAHI